jgi:hypothetical protein
VYLHIRRRRLGVRVHRRRFGVHVSASGVMVKLEVFKNLNKQNQTSNNVLAIQI